MKNKQLLCVLFPLLVACTGQRHQQQVSSESIIEEAVRKGEVLKGEIVPIDTALFRYAYRMRVQGDKAVILDLHNADYYYHVFTYPDFQYQSSFGKRGEGPGESIYAANIRFAGQDTVWVLDDGYSIRCNAFRFVSVVESGKIISKICITFCFEPTI